MVEPAVVTPGNHDGVHRGHRALVSAARARADRDGRRVIALFFDPRPVELLAPERARPALTTPARRAELLVEAGADAAVVERFDRAFAARTPREFARDVLQARHGARAVVVGADFVFGRDRTGDVDTLRRLGRELGFDVDVVDEVVDGEARISTTRIRNAITAGDVGAAATMLTRVHDVGGAVVHGDHRGRALGFPTANLDVEDVALPADGVYAVVARRPSGERLHGVANLGVRPSFDAGRAFEVHLLDFEGDLYGESLRVGLVRRLRPERAFDGREALVAQIGRDIMEARASLADVDEELLRCL